MSRHRINITNEVYAMLDYKKLYYKTFNAITDAERLVETAAAMLRTAQQECEEIHIEAGIPHSDDKL